MSLTRIIRKFFGEKSGIFYSYILFKYRWRPPLADVLQILENYSSTIKNVRFVQIGSNDGKSGDPIFRHVSDMNWQGILVEPVKFLFDQLRKNYAGHTELVRFENAAISRKSGKQMFYRLRNSENAPQWYDQLGSFNKEVLLNHKKHIPHLEELMIEEEVSTISIKDLMDKYKLDSFNLLHMDTEGYDYEILKTFPFHICKPDIILYEHKHLSENDFRASVQMLNANNYRLFSYEWDTIAVCKALISKYPSIIKTDRKFTKEETLSLLQFNRFPG